MSFNEEKEMVLDAFNGWNIPILKCIEGNADNNTLAGNASVSEHIFGWGGNDTINGGQSDYLYGGIGNDVLVGAVGYNNFSPGEGFDTIVMVGLWWIPATMLQGEARAHRIGQLNPVTVYYLIGQHTLDEVVRERVIERLDAWAETTGKTNDAALTAALTGNQSEDDLIAALVAAAQKEE